MKDRKLYILDAETDPFEFGQEVAPFLWDVYDGKTHQIFRETREVVEFLKDKHAVAYAHNGGKFDFLFFKDYLEPYTRVKIINERMAEFKIGRCLFRDSLLILPMALSQYKKDEIDYDLMRPENRWKPQNLGRITEYLRKDCEYTFELVSGFRAKYGKRLTLASSSLAVAKEIESLEIPKTTKYFYDYFKPYYHGGRVECFKSGVFKCKITVLDYNSAYPFAMLHDHPWGDSYVAHEGLPPSENQIPRAFLQVETEALGAFGIVEKGKLVFPRDGNRRTFHVTGWEYLAAKETGTLGDAKVLRSHVFDQRVNFKKYINQFYELKKAAPAQSTEYVFAKLFMNSLYGKFAANPEKYKEYVLVPPKDVRGIEAGDYPAYEGFIWHNDFGELSLMERPILVSQKRYYNIATAASITGFVRAMLWKAVCASKSPVLYSDTDSLLVAGEHGGKIGVELGELKVEAEGLLAGIAGKKLYCVKLKNGKWKTASKGGQLSGPQILKVAMGHTVVYKKDAPSMSIRGGVKFIERKFRRTA